MDTLESFLSFCCRYDPRLEPGRSGDFLLQRSVTPAGQTIALIPTSFQSAANGDPYRTVTLSHDFILYELIRGRQVVMSSAVIELYPLYQAYRRARGNVLLGGLGLGVLARLLCEKPEVTSVTAVELHGDIISLCGFRHEKMKILQGDFYTYVHSDPLEKYEYVFFDTFSEGEDLYGSVIIPMKRFFLETYPALRCDFWNEDHLKMEYFSSRGPALRTAH